MKRGARDFVILARHLSEVKPAAFFELLNERPTRKHLRARALHHLHPSALSLGVFEAVV